MRSLLDTLSPAIFVLLWSTGFIGSKLGAPYIEPFVFLTIRFLCVIPVLLAFAFLTRARWPGSGRDIGHCLVAGMLIHGVYLGGIFFAIDRGMPAGIAALVLGLQPLLTALLAGPLLQERIGARHWLGLAVGGGGLALVVLPQLGVAASGLTLVNALVCLLAVIGMAFGTVYQKKYAGGLDLMPATTLQYVGALLITLPLAAGESWRIEWSTQLIIALTWLVLVLSIGAILLLMVLIRRGSAARVASLFYLVPVAAAIESYFLFGETLGPVQIAGSALVVGALLMIRERRIGTRRTPA